MVANLSWATWAIRSRLLICLERSERIAHSCSFDLSSRLLIWFERNEKMSNERMSDFPALILWRKWRRIRAGHSWQLSRQCFHVQKANLLVACCLALNKLQLLYVFWHWKLKNVPYLISCRVVSSECLTQCMSRCEYREACCVPQLCRWLQSGAVSAQSCTSSPYCLYYSIVFEFTYWDCMRPC